MQPLSATRRHRARPRDPAPSKWKYKLQRMMLTPGVRGLLRVGVPLALIGIIAVSWYSQEDNRLATVAKYEALKATVQQRPEFMIAEMVVTGTDGALAAQVAGVLPMDFPVSSFALDLEAMRVAVEALDGVRSARVRLGDAGTLQVDVTPRVAVAIWRDDQNLRLIDEDGVYAGLIAARADRFDLPLIAGEGAQETIAEALALYRDAKPLHDRLRGMVRMGERRWDIVLDRNQRILLPAQGAMAALDRVIVLQQANDLLDRDVLAVDMRNPDRPTLKMNTEAAGALRRAGQYEAEN